MNRIYRVVWNHALGAWQVASELTGGRSRVRSASRNARRRLAGALTATAILASTAAFGDPAVFFDGVVSSGQANFTNVVTTANPTATIFSYDFGSSSINNFMVSAGGLNVYVETSRNGSSNSFSGGFDTWSVGATGGWSSAINEGFRLNFYADAGHTTSYMINAVGLSVYDWGTCCTGTHTTPGDGSAAGSAIYSVFDPDATQSTTMIGNITNSAQRADTDGDDLHFVAAIDDRNTFSSVVITPNGTGERFGAGGTLLFSVVGIGSVAPGSSIVTVGTPSVPDIDTALPFYTTAQLIAASVNPVFDGGTLAASSNGTISANLSVKAAGGTIDANGYNVTYSGVISDSGGASGSMTFTGTGTTTLDGVNTYTGATTINGGTTVNLNGSLASTNIAIASGATLNDNNGGLSSSASVTANGTLNLGTDEAINTLNGSGSVGLGNNTLTVSQGTFSGDISGTGGLAKAGAGTLVLSGNNTYSGTTDVNAGTLTLSGSLASSAITIASGATLNDSAGGLSSSSAVTVNGTLNIGTHEAINGLNGSGTVGLGANTLTVSQGSFSGAITGTGGLAKAGAGTLVLSGTNTYTGATDVNAGTLTLSGSLASTSITIASGATLNDNAGGLATSANVTANGALSLGANEAINTLAGSGTVSLGSNALTVNQGSFTGAISGSGSLTKASAGTLTLSGTNTYSGGTTISGGTLAVSSNNNLGQASGNLTLNNGTLQTTASFTTGRDTSLSGIGTFNTATGTTLIDNGAVNGTGALVKDGAGTLQLCGNVSHSGGTSVSGGRLDLCGNFTATGAINLASGTTLGVTGTTSLASSSGINNSGTVDISGTSSGTSTQSISGSGNIVLGNRNLTLSNASGTISGNISGSGGSLTVSGGTTTLSGSNTFTGATTIDSGATLALAGNGSINQSSSVTTNGTLNIASTTGGASINSLSGNGTVALGSKDLTLTNASGTFAGSISGSGGLNVHGGSEILSGTSSYTGGTTIGAGATIQVSANANLGAASGEIRLDGGTLRNTSSFSTVRNMVVTGNGTLSADNGTTLDASGNISGSGTLIKDGAGAINMSGDLAHAGGTVVNQGTLQLSGNNTYTGNTSLNGGTLKVSSDNNLGAIASNIIFNGGSLQATASFSSSRNITASGAGTLSTNNGATLTLDGSISGSGVLTKTGAGTLVLSGDSSGTHTPGSGWTGGMTVNDGLVQVTNAWGLGWGNLTINGGTVNTTVDILTGQTIALAGGTTVNVDSGTTTTMSGTITDAGGSGCFVKSGAGTLNLTGSVTQNSGTCVQQGELRANGNLISTVVVDADGTLRGSGHITGTTSVQGRLAPGNSPGTLTSSGTVTMLSGSTFQEDINGLGTASGPGNYSRLLVVGNGNQFVAGGATLAPNLTAITGAVTYTPYVPGIGDKFRIITAEGGIVGRFAPLTQPDGLASGTRMAVYYNVFGSNSIDLAIIPSSYAAFLSEGNANARSVGAALDRIVNIDQSGNATTTQSELAYSLSTLKTNQINSMFTALSGEVHGALAAVAPLSGNWMQSAVGRQIGNDQTEASGRRALWVEVGGDHARWGADSTASSFNTNRTLFALGGDLLETGALRLGSGFMNTKSRVSAERGSGSVEEYLLFMYGQYQLGSYSIDGVVGYGQNHYDTNRADPLGLTGTLKSGMNGSNALAGLTLRRSIDYGSFIIEPKARVLFQHTTREAGSEGNATPSALQLEHYSGNAARAVVGGIIGSAQRNPLQTRYTYQLDLGLGIDGGNALHPSLQSSLAGIQTTIQAPQIGRTFAEISSFGTMKVSSQAYVYVGINGEARSGKTGYGGNAGLRVSF